MQFPNESAIKADDPSTMSTKWWPTQPDFVLSGF